jgi:predicted cupin superfamily sugar epimerase
VKRSESVSRLAEEIPEEILAKDAGYWIERSQLEAHPEGGYFRQTYRADLVVPKQTLPAEFGGARAVSTAIYFLAGSSIIAEYSLADEGNAGRFDVV